MQDRPTYEELLESIERFLVEEIVPNTPGSPGFHARVAANAISTIRRELEAEDEQLAAEWAGLDALLGARERPAGRAALRKAIAGRNEALCERIRKGDADQGPFRNQALQHIGSSVYANLSVSNPDLLKRSQRDADQSAPNRP
jgi:hypothetical protein